MAISPLIFIIFFNIPSCKEGNSIKTYMMNIIFINKKNYDELILSIFAAKIKSFIDKAFIA